MSKLSDFLGGANTAITETTPGTALPGQGVIASSVGTVIPTDFIRTPTNVSPASGASGVAQNSSFTGNAFASGFSETRSNRTFQVALAPDTSFASPVFTQTINADSSGSASPVLAVNTGYRWRCRDTTTVGHVSDWSVATTFSTGAAFVRAPTITVEGQDNSVPETPLITTSAFQVVGGSDTHLNTDWEILDGAAVIYNSLADTVNKTSLRVPAGFLDPNTLYTFRARHRGTTYGPSAYGSKNATTLLQFEFGKYLAVSSTASPYVFLYGQNVDTFTKLPNPATLPTGKSYTTQFSADGTYLAVGHQTTPYITIYKRSGDTFTKLPRLPILPTGSASNVAFSADTVYLAVGYQGSPYLTIYKRSGDTFTTLPNPATLPPNSAGGKYSIAFSSDGIHLVISHNDSPYITIYKRSGDTFTKLPNPATLPPTNPSGVAFSQDGTYLVIVGNMAPCIIIYKRSGDTFTALANPTDVPTSGNGVSFSADGTYLVVANNSFPGIIIYKRSGDTFTKLPNPAVLPPTPTYDATFSQDGIYLALSAGNSPYMIIYKRSGDTFTRISNPNIIPTDDTYGISFFPVAVPGSG